MKQYVFSFYTDQGRTSVWDEAISASGMMEAFSKARRLLIKYKQEKGIPVRVRYKGVRYRHTDIA
ncbi:MULTISPECIES: hypothetical protein [Geobacillus]|uniref:Uncharacterized protein n=1 Tax=Geobacillus stearothermophilus TaxID=1422 RepID=A0A150N636_GEOSE|nr:hypothetical protein [Geobacillus stearothermophilus]KAF6511606.1 hypothetical protein GS8_1182 [Geobacillus stearothermophilus]KYD32106.1 hypothetical protein B4114_1483 [Geobacillus stearothermophilus]MED3663699.1 hypothetical protein [Geobacillus stearothermophilus]MED3719451.1 hypothetical protein [Geobacillus stearothermophilus]MED3722110.1 hypothetical protein [Geobacillus stearothermophilus]